MHHLLCSSQTGTGRTWCCEEVPLPSNIWGYSERGIQVLLYSPKRRREIANIIDEDAVYYSGLQKTRWLASSYRAITTLEKHYVTTVMHLQHKTGSTGEDGARAKGILKQLLSERFVVCHITVVGAPWNLVWTRQSYRKTKGLVLSVTTWYSKLVNERNSWKYSRYVAEKK